jgi:hypothetical protein
MPSDIFECVHMAVHFHKHLSRWTATLKVEIVRNVTIIGRLPTGYRTMPSKKFEVLWALTVYAKPVK